ncbi:jg16364 [Pararge aegeria aegeria]|uniref:Jg16364 protein n=1 Tax=Pararge aegeria aegeria TaxID=348720 RepID=A0A8S4QVT8_9NEOP|nr:jg16364 [Pararge aegeria aegeria]
MFQLDSTSCLFKEHIDLQKIAEIQFQNEKYNVLKPTIHVVKDHFVEFIQKRHNVDPSERIFLDKNGLRHIWKGVEFPRRRSLRKADIPQNAIDDIITNESTETLNRNLTEDTSKLINSNTTDTLITTKPGSEPKKLQSRRTVVKTTFFCPFFGLVRMSTHVDKFDEIGNVTRQ